MILAQLSASGNRVTTRPVTIALSRMGVDCQRCSDLRQIALAASRAYYKLLGDLEAAHICHNRETAMLLSIHLEAAFQSRNSAIAELANHESTHGAHPAEGI